MKQDQIIEHVLGLIDHFKGRNETGELTAAEDGIYLKCLAILVSKGGGDEHEPNGVVVRQDGSGLTSFEVRD